MGMFDGWSRLSWVSPNSKEVCSLFFLFLHSIPQNQKSRPLWSASSCYLDPYPPFIQALSLDSPPLFLAPNTEAGSKGIELVVENMYLPWEMLNTPDEMRHFLHDRMLGKLGMNLDFGHSLISGGGPQGYVHSLGKFIRHSHLHDNDGLYDMHLPLGEGNLPLVPALPQLVALNPDLVLLLELPLRRLEDFVEGRRRLLAALE